MNTNKDTKYWVFAGVGTIILISIFVGNKLGYRFGDNFALGKTGTVTMEIPTINTDIFVDENQKVTTTKDNEIIKLSLSSSKHSVIVSKQGYFPWKKDFIVPSGGSVTLSPIFVTTNASGQIIMKNDPEYYKIRNQIITDPTPKENSPHISKDGSKWLWLEDNAITVKTATATTTVIQPDTVIRNVYFYKDRSDYVIFSTSNSVFVIETDKIGTQNFIPIFRGTSPSFIEPDPSFIYVLDGETLMQVII